MLCSINFQQRFCLNNVRIDHMEIRFLGNQSIYVKGKKESVIVNPETDKVFTKYDSRIVAFNKKELDFMTLSNEKVILRGAGEYEVGGIEIQAISAGNGDVVYVFTVEGVRVGVVGKLNEALSDKKQDKITDLDVLLISVDNDKISCKNMVALAKKWGANYLIPVGYTEKDANFVKFLDEVDSEGQEEVESIKMEKENLPDGMEVVVLKIN